MRRSVRPTIALLGPNDELQRPVVIQRNTSVPRVSVLFEARGILIGGIESSWKLSMSVEMDVCDTVRLNHGVAKVATFFHGGSTSVSQESGKRFMSLSSS